MANEFKKIGQQLDAGNFSGWALLGKKHVRSGPYKTKEIGREWRHLVGL